MERDDKPKKAVKPPAKPKVYERPRGGPAKPIADLMPQMPWLNEAPVFLLFLANGRRTPFIAEMRGKPFPNDHLDLFFNATVDASIVLATFVRAAEAMGLGDRIAVMEAGKIRQLGQPVEIYDDPADTFVATFIGSPPMNLVERDGQLVGFRPEPLRPIEHVPGGGRVSMPFHIERVEYLSGDRHVYGTITGLGAQTRVIARLPSTVDTPISSDEVHEFAVPTSRLRFFDAESGERSEPVPVGASS